MARMDEKAAINVGVAVLVAVLLVVAYLIRWLRLRETKRRMGEFLAGYFNGDLPLDQLGRRAREVASGSFMGSPECHALEIEKQRLTALADVKSEFGLPDRYQNEGWKAGRE